MNIFDHNLSTLSSPLFTKGMTSYAICKMKAHGLTFVCKSTRQFINSIVPEPLISNSDNHIQLLISHIDYDYDLYKGPYHEIIFNIPVTCSITDEEGSYMALLYLDNAVPYTMGREIYGLAKKDGVIDAEFSPLFTHGTLTRNGKTLIRFEAKQKLQLVSSPQNLPDWKAFCLKIIPSAEANKLPEVLQLVRCASKNICLFESYEMKGSFDLFTSEDDPLNTLPILEIISCTYTSFEGDFGFGKIIYDYLKPNA